MRILYHHRSLGDGAEGIHIDAMIGALRALGHEVDVVSLAAPAGRGHGDAGLLAALRHRLSGWPSELARVAANAAEFAAMARTVSRRRPDAIYKRHALYDVGAARAAARRGVPLVLEVNTLYSLPVVRQFEPLHLPALAARFEAAALRSARLVVAVSTPLAGHIRDLAGPDVPVLVCPNGADPTQFDPGTADGTTVRRRYGLERRFVVGWSGVLRAWHGLDLLLEALRRLPDASLLVVGDGPERQPLEQRAASLGLADRVRVAGRVAHREVPDHVAAFDAAVAADDRTGLASPMKVVEYMALARPVVVPDLANFRDLVQPGRTGLVFAPRDADDLAGRLRALAESPELATRLGAAARAEVCTRLNWLAIARSITDALAATPRPASRAS